MSEPGEHDHPLPDCLNLDPEHRARYLEILAQHAAGKSDPKRASLPARDHDQRAMYRKTFGLSSGKRWKGASDLDNY